MPVSSGPIVSSTAETAFSTPLPPKRRGSPSRSSTASCSPVDAPEGTAARASVPSSSATSTSTVGLPRESKISRAPTCSITATCLLLNRFRDVSAREYPAREFARWRLARRPRRNRESRVGNFWNTSRAGSVDATMTGDAQETFEAFRRAESLVAQRRPLDALAVLAPVLETEPDKSSVHLLAGRAYLISAQLR